MVIIEANLCRCSIIGKCPVNKGHLPINCMPVVAYKAFCATVSISIHPPMDTHPLQPLLGAVCQICHTAPSPPRANTSKRPSALLHTASRSTHPPIEAHPLQLPLGAICQLCHTALSLPRANISRRPSAF